MASRQSDKPNPFHYAQRTVDVAWAGLWLDEGWPERRCSGGVSEEACSWVEATTAVWAVKASSCIQFRGGARTVLRTGRIVTLHPWEGTVGKPASALGETSGIR